MNPLDCFTQLWMVARHALEGQSLRRVSTVYYHGQRTDDPVGAEYLPDGQIRIFRPASLLPVNPDEPAADATTQEVCSLAHEFGHHVSKVSGMRIPEYEAALGIFDTWRAPAPGAIGRCPTKAEQALILAEEALAWTNAYQLLKDRGVTDWAEFNDERERGLANYRTIFRNMEGPNWVLPEQR